MQSKVQRGSAIQMAYTHIIQVASTSEHTCLGGGAESGLNRILISLLIPLADRADHVGSYITLYLFILHIIPRIPHAKPGDAINDVYCLSAVPIIALLLRTAGLG